MGAHVAVTPCHNILAISASLLLFAIPLVLVGCGLTINSTAGSGPGQGTGSTGGSGSSGDGGPAGGQTIPPPDTLEALTGCRNPNTGVSKWRLGCRDRPCLHHSWITRHRLSGSPNLQVECCLLDLSRKCARAINSADRRFHGCNEDRTFRSYSFRELPTGKHWSAEAAPSIPTTQQGTTGLSFIIPSTFSGRRLWI